MTDKTPVDLDHLDALYRVTGRMAFEPSYQCFETMAGDEREFLAAVANAYPAMAEEMWRLRARVAELEAENAAVKKGRWVIFDKHDRQYRFRDRVSWHASPGRCQSPWPSEEAATAVCHGYPVINLDKFAELEGK